MFDLPEVEITAKEMGDAISTVAEKLLEFDIVTPNGYAVMCEEGKRVKAGRESKSWNIRVDRENAIVFQGTCDKNSEIIVPSITCAGISVDQSDHSRPPFTALDIAIEIFDEMHNPIARWHVDWANETTAGIQPGPLTHLQYGGHFAGYRDLDPRVKEPRWTHPPMDLILMCEVAAANFFESRWEILREDSNWCNAISLAQRFCYSSYLRKICRGMSVSSRSLLHTMWASEWRAVK